jgi:hypothetical protein
MEEKLFQHYGWHPFWRASLHPPLGPEMAAVAQVMAASGQEKHEAEFGQEGPYLSSTREVIGCKIQGSDGEIGKVIDFIVQDDTWDICHLVVDTGEWLSGKLVLVSPTWIEGDVDWKEKSARIGFARKVFERAPEFDPTRPIDRAYEVGLYDYYGRLTCLS